MHLARFGGRGSAAAKHHPAMRDLLAEPDDAVLPWPNSPIPKFLFPSHPPRPSSPHLHPETPMEEANEAQPPPMPQADAPEDADRPPPTPMDQEGGQAAAAEPMEDEASGGDATAEPMEDDAAPSSTAAVDDSTIARKRRRRKKQFLDMVPTEGIRVLHASSSSAAATAHLTGIPRRRGRPPTNSSLRLARELDSEALIALAAGFPADTLSDDEVAAAVLPRIFLVLLRLALRLLRPPRHGGEQRRGRRGTSWRSCSRTATRRLHGHDLSPGLPDTAAVGGGKRR